MDARAKEAAKLGFTSALAPRPAEEALAMKVYGVTRLSEAVDRIARGDFDGTG